MISVSISVVGLAHLGFSTYTTLRNSEQIEVRECLLPLGAEALVFQFAIQKFKAQDI